MSIKALVERVTGGGLGNVLARGTAGSFVVSVIGTGLMYLTEMLYTRVLGVEQYGYYAYAMTWAGLLALLCRFGADASILRYGAADSAEGRWPAFWGLMSWANRLALAASLVACGILALSVWGLRDSLETNTRLCLWASTVVLPPATLIVLRGAALRSLGHAALSRTLLSLFRPVLLSGLIMVVYLLVGGTPTSVQATLTAGVAMTLTAVAGSLLVRRVTDASTRRKPWESHWKKWLDLALPALFISSLHILLHYSDKVMLGMMVGTRETGIYVIVVKSAGLIGFGLQAVNTVLAPMVSRLYSSGQLRELQRILTLGTRAGFVLAIPPALIFLVVGDWVLSAFGISFTEGFQSLRISTSGHLVNVLVGPTALLMMMTGHQKQLLAFFAICAALNLALNWLFIPVWGMNGAATSTTLCMVLWNLMVLVFIIRKLRLDPTVFGIVRPADLVDRTNGEAS